MKTSFWMHHVNRSTDHGDGYLRRRSIRAIATAAAVVAAIVNWETVNADQVISIGPSSGVAPANVLHAENYSAVHADGFGVSSIGGVDRVDVQITNVPPEVTIMPSSFSSFVPADSINTASSTYPITIAITNLPAGTYTLYVVASSTNTSITPKVRPFTIDVSPRAFWVGTNTASTAWSSDTNWSPVTPAGNDVVFENQPIDVGTNTVTSSVTVGRLTYLRSIYTTHWRTTLSSGVTLTVTNGFSANSIDSANGGGNSHTFGLTITGSGGATLLVTNFSKDFSLNTVNSQTSATTYRFDLTTLPNLRAYVNRFSANDVTAITDGTVGAQNVRCDFPNNMVIVANYVGDYTQEQFTNSVQFFNHGDSGYNNGSLLTNSLGTTTTIWADSFGVGRGRANNCALGARSGTSTATFRNSDGVSRMSLFGVGVDSGTTSVNSGLKATFGGFSGNTLDVLADKLWLGRCRPRQSIIANAQIGGTIGFGGGTVDVNTAVLGYQIATNDNTCFGIINMNGSAKLVVNQEMVLGYSIGDYANGFYATSGGGQLNILTSGASARINRITCGGPSKVSTHNWIGVTSGSLILTNTIGAADGKLNILGITNGSVTLHLNGLNPRIYTKILASSGTATINIAAITNIGVYPAQIPLISYETSFAAFTLGSIPSASPAYQGNLVTNIANSSIDLLLTNGPVQPGPVSWTGASDSNWDVLTTTNWVDNGTPYIYGNGVPVRFDNSAATGNINLTTVLTPLSTVVSNSSLAYVFSGTGKLSGSGSLTKQSSGTLTIANTGVNDLTGGLTISGGTVQVGNADASGDLGAGAVINNAALEFNRSDNSGVANNISGTGSLTQNGGGTIALSGGCTYSGATIVNAGTLGLVSSTTIANSSSITVAAGATLDASTRTDGTLTLTSGQLLRGNGTVLGNITADSGSTVSPGQSVGVLTATGTVVLSGTTTIEIDKTAATNDLLRAGSIIYGGTLVVSSLSAALAPGDSFHIFEATNYSGSFTNIVPGTPSVGLVWDVSDLVNGNIAVALDIPVVTWTGIQNTLWDLTTTNWLRLGSPSVYTNGWTALLDDSSANNTVSLVGSLSPNRTIVSNVIVSTYSLGGSGKLTGSGGLTKYGSGTLIVANSGINDFAGNLSINGGTVQIGNGGANGTPGAGNVINNGTLAFNRSGSLTVTNAISGNGSLTKDGSGTVALSGAVTHSGSTLISAGTLELDGLTSLSSSPDITIASGAVLDASTRTDGTLTLASGQTLHGNGLLQGNLVANAGSIVSPGQSAGTLLASGAVTLQGTTLIEIDKTAGTNDLLGSGIITYGGTLVMSNLSAALADGDVLKIFDATNYYGAFANIIPKRPATGLAWDTNDLADSGILKVTLAPPVVPTPSLKIDFDIAGRPLALDPNFLSWVIIDGSSISNTFGGVTIILTKVGPHGAVLTADWWKSGVEDFHAAVADDGVTVDETGDSGAQIEMRILGLSPGPHTIATYHNTWGDPSTHSYSPIDISINGVLTITNLVPSNRVTNNYDATSALMQIEAVEDQDVVILYQAVTNTGANVKNVSIDSLEIDTVDSTTKALNPTPANRDEHVDADADKSVLMKWFAAASAVSHDVYFGTSSNAVQTATNGSPEFMGNQAGTNVLVTNLSTFATYYWRVDEVNATNGVAKGDLWYFRTRHLAFPGAEGYGRFARGGRGGRVIEVTNLNDSGPGSFRDAVSQTGPRTIVFAVSGLITLESPLTVSKENSKVTIAGQTAPGKGINIRKYAFGFSGGDDVIVRHMRVYPGHLAGVTLNGMGFGGVNNSIMDHCSSGWSLDECIPSRGAKNMTIQNVMIAEPLNQAGHKNYPPGTRHGYASSTSGDIGSWHHDLLTHSEGRNWSLAGGLTGDGVLAGRLDIRCNVVYNWNGRTTDGGVARLNFVNNYYKVGPCNGIKTYLNPDHGTNSDGSIGQLYYSSGNVMPGYPQNNTGAWMTNQPFFPSYVTTQSATNAYKIVMSDVGCTQPVIDDHDTRVLNETRTGTYTYSGSASGLPGLPDSENDVGGWENYPEIHRAANFDTDHDGLPDWWEVMKGLNPNSAPGDFSDSNADLESDEYTELDRYLNWMAVPHYDCAQNGSLDVDLSQYTKGFISAPVHSASNPTNGTVVILGDGKTARFTPTTNFVGLAEYRFSVVDSAGDSMTNKVIGIHVAAANTAPQLAAISNRVVNAGVNVVVTNVATDSDVPAQTLTFSLLTGPTNAALGTNSGVFTFRPLVTQANTTNLITMTVTDDGVPTLSATQSFSINVNPLTTPTVSSPTRIGGQFVATINGQVGPDYGVLASTNLLDWNLILITNPTVVPFTWTDTNTSLYQKRFYRIKIGPPLP